MLKIKNCYYFNLYATILENSCFFFFLRREIKVLNCVIIENLYLLLLYGYLFKI